MHPLIAHYINPDTARDTLRKAQDGAPLSPEERFFSQTAAAYPEHRGTLMGTGAKRHLSSDAEAAVLFLAAHAAARALLEDPTLGTPTRQAREALQQEGASEQETDAFIASILMEEAFGYEQEGVDTFDASYVQEALGEVPALAALSREQVDAMLVSFERAGKSEAERTVRARIARALVNTAWEEGPTPINPEHIEAHYEAALADKPEEELEAGLRATVDFLQLLAREGLVGPQRLSRLRAQLGDEEA